MKRLFIGLPIESKIAAQISAPWQNDRVLNQNRISWTKPENWHITLVFLGDTPESGIDMLQQIIEKSFDAVQAYKTQLIGANVFPNSHNPKVLWLGLKDVQSLMPAHAQVGELLLQNNFLFDNKPLKPHLTLARIKSLENRVSFDALMKEYQLFNFGIVAINRVVLFESILTSGGLVYKQLFVRQLLSR